LATTIDRIANSSQLCPLHIQYTAAKKEYISAINPDITMVKNSIQDKGYFHDACSVAVAIGAHLQPR